MLSRFVGAALVLFIGGVVLAGEYTGLITKYSDKEVHFKTRGKKGSDKKGEEKKLDVTKDVKITKGKDGTDTLTSKELHELVKTAVDGDKGPKGVFAKITTNDDDKVTAINVIQRKGKKGK